MSSGEEVRLGRMVGPLSIEDFPQVHINRFGVIPKNHQPGKWRLIVDLSHPRGKSVNNGIRPELCSLRYSSVDEAVRRLLAWGQDSMMMKIDIESAYRIVLVNPEDRLLLGMKWKERLYVDTALTFGLRSAPKIFSALADALLWILESEGVDGLHYLDDFLIFGPPSLEESGDLLAKVLEIFARLGIPVARDKTEGPTRVITFLGIEIDGDAGILRLPKEKLTSCSRVGR